MRRPHTNAEVTYFIATASPTALHLRDFVRLAEVDFQREISLPTANATISPDPRFCWAGKGVYGLLRHGLLPGPRNLEEAARLLLTATDRALTIEAIEFCLKKLSYRFSSASLYNAICRSPTIEWNGPDGHFRVPATGERDRNLLRDVPIVPHARRDEWQALQEFVIAFIDGALAERNERLRDVDSRRLSNYGWE